MKHHAAEARGISARRGISRRMGGDVVATNRSSTGQARASGSSAATPSQAGRVPLERTETNEGMSSVSDFGTAIGLLQRFPNPLTPPNAPCKIPEAIIVTIASFRYLGFL